MSIPTITIREITIPCCDQCDQPADNIVHIVSDGDGIITERLCERHTDHWREVEASLQVRRAKEG